MSKKKDKPNRFADWTFGSEGNVIPLEPGQILVNDDPIGDPYKFARHGQEELVPRKPPAPRKGG